jgi:hypothetical protein
MSGIGTAGHHHHDAGPSDPGTVVLDIGAELGALIIYTTAQQLGLEIEISPGKTSDARRTHMAVRARNLDSHTIYGAVYPSLVEGIYTIWLDADTVLATVSVHGAQVTQFSWPAR